MIVLIILAVIIALIFGVWYYRISFSSQVIKDIKWSISKNSTREIRIYVTNDTVTVNGHWYRTVYYPEASKGCDLYIFNYDDITSNLDWKITDSAKTVIKDILFELTKGVKNGTDEPRDTLQS